MFNLFKNLETDKILQTAKNHVTLTNSLEEKIQVLTDYEIKEELNKLQKAYQHEKNLDKLLPQSFALTREASKRVLGLRHYDTQILGGSCLHNCKIAEMKTGEGKTLAATLPVALNALTGQGTHVVTVNDYLAKRDAQTMGKIYKFLGLSVGLIQEGMEQQARKENYATDVTYVTNSELAFDYLRDNMASSLDDLVQRAFNYCIVDEVDSILIDEARTPLIISESQEIPIEKYILADEATKYLQPGTHYLVDEKSKTIRLTNQGITQLETILQTKNLYDPSNPWIPYIINSLKAQTLFLKDSNYIVKNNDILIIDEFTGRIMPDRRWSDGLHQAVEAKEKVTIKQGSETLGSITYQNFFRLYPKLSGMTGTAKTAEKELTKIYNLEVIEIPTAKALKRKDLNDLVYLDEYTKWKEIAKQTEKSYKRGQPVLIGTISIEKSEIISQLLYDLNIPHQLLNAKPENIARESEIVAQAGCYKAVTVATNMAGRGTDILLGGNPTFLTKKQILTIQTLLAKKQFLPPIIELLRKIKINKKITLASFSKIISLLTSLSPKELNLIIENPIKSTQQELLVSDIKKHLTKKNQKQCEIEKRKITDLGGLFIVGTERHESKRIDNQLRGRAGRQGDPGMSRFFLSLDDELLRVFGGEKIKTIMTNFNLENDAIEAPTLTKTIDNAQKRVEDYFYDTRKQLFEYDEVLNVQRLAIFKERRAVLEYNSIRSEMVSYGENLMLAYETELNKKPQEHERIWSEIAYLMNNPLLNLLEKQTNLNQLFWVNYDLKEAEFESYALGLIRILEKEVLLLEIDKNWKKHLKEIELLKDSIRWRGYGQLDPLAEYKKESYNLFVETIQNIKYNSVYNIMKSRFS